MTGNIARTCVKGRSRPKAEHVATLENAVLHSGKLHRHDEIASYLISSSARKQECLRHVDAEIAS